LILVFIICLTSSFKTNDSSCFVLSFQHNNVVSSTIKNQRNALFEKTNGVSKTTSRHSLLYMTNNNIESKKKKEESNNNNDNDNNKKNNESLSVLQNVSNSLGKLPGGTIILLLIGLRSFIQLFDEVPNLRFNGKPDFIGTSFDFFFVFYALQNVLQQTGLLQPTASEKIISSLEETECCVTLDIGREKNTLMEKNFAASGKRLLLPINIRFTSERLDLGIPGEEALGGRYCNVLKVLNKEVTFVGPKGETKVPILNGGWTCLPLKDKDKKETSSDVSKLRFFLDFPAGAFKDDVYIPPFGRVFFGGIYFRTKNSIKPKEVVYSLEEDNALLEKGALSMKKKNGIRNVYGALGNINLILGKYTVGPIKSNLL